MRARTPKQPQVKKELCRVLKEVDVDVVERVLENDRGAVETSFACLIACFDNKTTIIIIIIVINFILRSCY